jgi:serine/threonine protein phosphatase PrpC
VNPALNSVMTAVEYAGLSDIGRERPSNHGELAAATAQLSNDLRTFGGMEPALAGATTTVVAALVTDSRALVAHLGDSRALPLLRTATAAPVRP